MCCKFITESELFGMEKEMMVLDRGWQKGGVPFWKRDEWIEGLEKVMKSRGLMTGQLKKIETVYGKGFKWRL